MKARLKDLSRDYITGKARLTFEVDGVLPELPDGDLDLKIKKWRETRSKDANALLWHCIGEIANVVGETNWKVYLSLLKDYGQFTYICVHPQAVEAVKKQWREVVELGEISINGTKAVQLLCYYGSSTYNTAEFSRLLDGTMEEMRQIGLTPPADEQIERSLREWERKCGKQ